MQMILFKLNQQFYLISAASVEEVIDTIEITPVPLAAKWVKGLINLRGAVMTVVGLSELIGVPESKEYKNILIMKKDDKRKGLLIEEVSEILDVDPEKVVLNDDAKEQNKYYSGIVSFPDKVANVVDVTKMIF
ncbi:MAG: chemotaxis protein CheW [Liquorilactobacillus ghanensis]|jgi:purine-binding chemotaxis protein CheW|uniref:Chemotaxis protein CheW n=3 Tax=Liquorilactobacillus ghanensis TaxID=399370 RepID=A0A0R1VK48_9LACO|nr:chemotaxis protein CheW [Liquorilactobacillus ghanensis]AJA33981.1 purine-binding chemotaxis protein CheW [Liquorilactobacillus ghanensis]KRM05978.1 chemotaxis protein CheW [Liquorilactobacillus ghanensis DSM 18630]